LTLFGLYLQFFCVLERHWNERGCGWSAKTGLPKAPIYRVFRERSLTTRLP